MKHQLGKISVRDTAEALKVAEAQLERPAVTNGGPVFAQLRPQDIKERLELFQPRRPGYGLRTLDTGHVKKLAVRIERKDMDPVLVVKLGREWVVVDGHHRLAAYRRLKHAESIKCEWFAGTVRNATDESLRRNEKTHLEVQQGDKWEEAWKRTLLGWGSKSVVVKLTGTSDGMVARMRRANKCHRKFNKEPQSDADQLWGEKLHSQLGSDLRAHSWSKVNRVLLDLTPTEWNMNDDAARLAGSISRRLTNTLSEDPEVTARALWLYDRDLCPKLFEALQGYMREQEAEERSLEDQAAYEKLNETP